MTARPDESLDVAQPIGRTAVVLRNWYASHPVVRRLWAIEAETMLRIVVTLEPTPDGDDTLPAWLANSRTWARELQLEMDRTVRLEMIGERSNMPSIIDAKDVLVAELSWRDPANSAD
jgi:hypothetical protein